MSTDQAFKTLSDLYSQYEQHAAGEADPYILQHANSAMIQRQIHSSLMYLPYVSGKTLDWGCKHAPDSCLLQHFKGGALDLYGCDASWASDYGSFADFYQSAKLKFTPLEHPFLLPYQDSFFDTIVGSGVLEHVPNDYESIKEIYRILKPDGHFIITFLPNFYSYTESLTKFLGKPCHTRRYLLKEVENLLLHSGFQVLQTKYFLMMPTMMSGAEKLWPLNRFLENIWPLNLLSSNLLIIAQKRTYML
jgi:SAM-dependent methyltransferase